MRPLRKLPCRMRITTSIQRSCFSSKRASMRTSLESWRRNPCGAVACGGLARGVDFDIVGKQGMQHFAVNEIGHAADHRFGQQVGARQEAQGFAFDRGGTGARRQLRTIQGQAQQDAG
jgi:hypothetical protein